MLFRSMQRPGSPAIASISHEVGRYGPRLIELGLALLRGETVAPYNYVEQKAITADRAGRGLEADAAAAAVSKPADESKSAAKRGRKPKESAGKKAK